MRNPAAGLTSAAPLAEAPVAGGTLLAAQAADAGQAAALSRLHVAAAPHSTDVAVAPLAAGASLEAVVPLLGRSRSAGAPLTEGRRVPAQALSRHAGDPHSPGSGRSAGLSPRPCRSTGQSVGGMSRSRKANSCTLPGKRYIQLCAEPETGQLLPNPLIPDREPPGNVSDYHRPSPLGPAPTDYLFPLPSPRTALFFSSCCS